MRKSSRHHEDLVALSFITDHSCAYIIVHINIYVIICCMTNTPLFSFLLRSTCALPRLLLAPGSHILFAYLCFSFCPLSFTCKYVQPITYLITSSPTSYALPDIVFSLFPSWHQFPKIMLYPHFNILTYGYSLIFSRIVFNLWPSQGHICDPSSPNLTWPVINYTLPWNSRLLLPSIF